MSGTSIRQDWLSTNLQWIADYKGIPKRNENGDSYMSDHQNDTDANELRHYYEDVMTWVGEKFKVYRKEEKGLPWGYWYNSYVRGDCGNKLIEKDKDSIEKKILQLIDDDEVGSVRGIYEFLIDGLEKHLSLRAFDKKMARKVYEKQKHKCPYCDEKVGGHTYMKGNTEYPFKEMEADHIVPWSNGGKTEESNCQMLCKWHNGHKSNN